MIEKQASLFELTAAASVSELAFYFNSVAAGHFVSDMANSTYYNVGAPRIRYDHGVPRF